MFRFTRRSNGINIDLTSSYDVDTAHGRRQANRAERWCCSLIRLLPLLLLLRCCDADADLYAVDRLSSVINNANNGVRKLTRTIRASSTRRDETQAQPGPARSGRSRTRTVVRTLVSIAICEVAAAASPSGRRRPGGRDGTRCQRTPYTGLSVDRSFGRSSVDTVLSVAAMSGLRERMQQPWKLAASTVLARYTSEISRRPTTRRSAASGGYGRVALR